MLNRPDQRNALSLALLDRLFDQLAAVLGDERVRAVVLTGAGAAFTAGMDLKEAGAEAALGDLQRNQSARVRLERLARILTTLHASRKPTIAALNGDAIAGGAGIAGACDVAIAAENARIGYPEARRGLVAAVVLPDLVRAIGDRRARRLLLTGELIPARQACDWGLVTSVTTRDDCVAEALRIGSLMAEGGPDALAAIKGLLEERTGTPALTAAIEASLKARDSDEGREGVRAFLERRPPAWAQHDPRSPAREAHS